MENLSELFIPTGELLLTTKLLKDKDLMANDNPAPLSAGKSYPIETGDVVFSIGANASLDVKLFNDENDNDEDNFLATKDKPITFDTANTAYLKYRGAITAKASGQVSLENLGFNADFSVTGGAKHLYYSGHNNTESINKAFLFDISHFKTIFRFEDVENLEVNNALALLVNGTLNAGLSVSWSNIFSQSLSALTNQLKTPLTLDINIGPQLTAAFNVSIKDDFFYFIKKIDKDNCLVSVRKAKSSVASGNIGASIGISFAQPDVLQTQLFDLYNKVIQSLTASTATEVEQVIANIESASADPTKKVLIAKLLGLFGLQNIPENLQLLVSKLHDFEKDIKGNLQKIALANITFSFKVEYSRIEENTELLSVSLPTAVLKNYHKDLLRFRTGNLLQDMRKNTIPFILNTYLNEQKLVVERSFGFGLKLFNMSIISSKDYSTRKRFIRTNLTQNKQVLIDNTAGYTWSLGKAQGSWMGELCGTMANFSKQVIPTADEFDFSLTLNMIQKDNKMSLNDFKSYLDTAVLWSIMKQEDANAFANKYAGSEIIGQEVWIEHKLIFPDNTLKLILQQIDIIGWSNINIDTFCFAMAASMSYLPDFVLRASKQERQNTYAGAWKTFIQNHELDRGQYADIIASVIDEKGNPDNLSAFETNSSNWTFGDSFEGVIRSNPGLFDALTDFINGIIDWNNNIAQHTSFDRLDHSYNKISGIFKQSFYLKTLGCFLLTHAERLNLTKDVKRIFTISYGAADNKQVINFAMI
ncbi:hypothetical protein QTN47_02270 [Danxiaibacter flavus]|uniref:Uncharacterized protein n=1 Tax=Danxiaibacter flavus TaxID=3049108 RepID=A0ABV3ZD08_9BACT|nr:hypothetical protein QNM32_02270 [Chitinophagaceae bacterium DXS]